MTKIDYTKSKIYKIWSPLGDKIYIGSTTKDYLCQRMTAHRNSYDRWKQGDGALTTSYLLFDEYDISNCFIELIEAKKCSSKDEQKQLEGFYIRTLTCVNKYIPNRTSKEYREANKNTIKERNKKFKEANKDTLKVKNKDYREVNKDKIKAYRELNRITK